jgi:hypothetical protein
MSKSKLALSEYNETFSGISFIVFTLQEIKLQCIVFWGTRGMSPRTFDVLIMATCIVQHC